MNVKQKIVTAVGLLACYFSLWLDKPPGYRLHLAFVYFIFTVAAVAYFAGKPKKVPAKRES